MQNNIYGVVARIAVYNLLFMHASSVYPSNRIQDQARVDQKYGDCLRRGWVRVLHALMWMGFQLVCT
jgi:hypothetical protein